MQSSPVLPAFFPPCSWVINLGSPIVGVPFPVFLIALVVGHIPINFISVKVGAMADGCMVCLAAWAQQERLLGPLLH